MICLVTDRRRLAPADATFADARRCLVAQARYAADAGVNLIQVRERDLDAADLAALTSDLVAVTRGSATRVVVNDRLDVALACGAGGVHLRGDSIGVAAARRLTPAEFLIGRSVHGVDDALKAAGADYVIAGTVFPSVSKSAGQTRLGLDGLLAVVTSVDTPVLAIGGITEAHVERVAATRADGVAAIGLFMAQEGPPDRASQSSCRAIPLVGLVERLRAVFDRVRRGP